MEKRKLKSIEGTLPLEISPDNFVFNKSDFEEFLDSFNRSYSKSGMYNLVNFYKGPQGFSLGSILKLLSPNEDLNSISWENYLEKNKEYVKIKKSILSKISTIISKECKFVGWLNQNYLNRLFNIDVLEIDGVFNKGTTLLAKLIFFFNSLHKQKIDEDLIMLLVNRIERFSNSDLKISNLFYYVKPKNVTFSNINQKNNLLKYNRKNLNMLTIGLNKNRKASVKIDQQYDKIKTKGKKIMNLVVKYESMDPLAEERKNKKKSSEN